MPNLCPRSAGRLALIAAALLSLLVFGCASMPMNIPGALPPARDAANAEP
ncbi:MAG: hypothetical protein KF715_20575 [Candidatus Didemnitutus sp.]|nr:hypothetical protein [Candidatus Didemnitutus sp.]